MADTGRIMTEIRGIPASPGVAIGAAWIFRHQDLQISDEPIDGKAVEAEFQRFLDGRARAEEELHEIHRKALATLGAEEAEIFEGHIELLGDDEIESEVRSAITGELMCAEKAASVVMERNAADMEALDDEYMRERGADLRDIGKRLVYAIAGVELASLDAVPEPVIVVADDLTPSDTAQMDAEKILGFATSSGGPTSHVAIMARTLAIPAVVGCGDELSRLAGNTPVVLDGTEGVLHPHPDRDRVTEYERRIEAARVEAASLSTFKDLPAETNDGRRVEVCANIGTDRDVHSALEHGAEGVGLYRTEFLFMDKSEMPGEEEQFHSYKAVAEAMGDRGVTVRTLDIGGDKGLDYLEFPRELNPFLGWRAIRMCLDAPEILDTQLRSLLRASHFGKLRIMFPMVISVEEIRRLKTRIKEIMDDLRSAEIPFDPDVEIGIMIETPAAVVIASHLAREVDFFSIGTNDLTQYTLAVDRGNEKIAHLYDPLHPAVLASIRNVIEAAHERNKWVGMCGELAGDERASVVLLGMGLDEFSMSAPAIARVKRAIRRVSYADAQSLAAEVAKLGTSAEIRALLNTTP